MIQKIVASICLLFSLGIFAQQGTSSPYSYYGIGEIKFRGTFDNRAMGGLSVFPDSTHVNIQNPASLGHLKLINYTMGGMTGGSTLKTSTQSEGARRSSIDYLAVGMPTGTRLGLYFGLLPYSAVGYNVKSVTHVSSTLNETQSSTGTGGVNKGFLGFGYRITNNLSAGVDVNYNFGHIATKDITSRDSVQNATRELNTSDVSGVNFNAGLMWQSKLTKKTSFFASVRYTPQSTLKSSNVRSISTITFSPNGSEVLVDSLAGSRGVVNIKMPSRFSVGAGFGHTRKWQIGAEFTLSKSDEFSNRFADITQATFKSSQRYILGGYYIPKYNSYSSYFKTITYRGGFRYDAAGMYVKGQPINEMALSLGAGLPIGGRFSNFNIGIELGKRGTTKAGLVQENYLNLFMSLSLNDQWFVRRKYN